jgi:hypothetical protein
MPGAPNRIGCPLALAPTGGYPSRHPTCRPHTGRVRATLTGGHTYADTTIALAQRYSQIKFWYCGTAVLPCHTTTVLWFYLEQMLGLLRCCAAALLRCPTMVLLVLRNRVYRRLVHDSHCRRPALPEPRQCAAAAPSAPQRLRLLPTPATRAARQASQVASWCAACRQQPACCHRAATRHAMCMPPPASTRRGFISIVAYWRTTVGRLLRPY